MNKTVTNSDLDMANNETLLCLNSLLSRFLKQFIWTPNLISNDLAAQEARGDETLKGVCYDACKYLAQKLKEHGIEYKSWWIGQKGKQFIEKWRKCEGLHSFNLCRIPVVLNNESKTRYYFADNAIAPYYFLKGFHSENEAIAAAIKLIAGEEPYMLREFNPLAVRMGNNVFYTIARIINLNI
jgi:hypothetical protein